MKPGFEAELNQTYAAIRKSLKTSPRGYEWRRQQLLALKLLLVENEKSINDALWADFHKGAFEAAATEQGIVISEIDFVLENLETWMEPISVSTPLFNQIGTSEIRHDPFGVTLVIGAWNYPINLLLAPVVGALSGGNAVILKPSEISANVAKLIGELIPKYLDKNLIAVVQGGPDETEILLKLKFDLIFFTGSGKVGTIVAEKAAKSLTPTILELGGKSPALVLADADIKVTAKRLVWGKFMNAGQTCVAPDYLLVQPSVKKELLSEMIACIQEFYGEQIQENKDYCRIINERNFDRLVGLLEGSKILFGGKSDRASRFISPTLLESKPESKAMSEEIFGPILPILEISELSQMIEFVNERPKPLALYVFGHDLGNIDRVLEETSSGGVSVNDVIMHMASPNLPFGGVGASGMGNYHGEYSFRAFTHEKSVLKKSTLIDVPLRYAPYTDSKIKWIKRLI
ncbi:MAG: aldehyde dehydrogenase family protein [Cryobacterium sp.]|nr:aldehyde dehydrogenase family protein [Oligoflexia bacterium]